MQTPNGFFSPGENPLELGENKFNTLNIVNKAKGQSVNWPNSKYIVSSYS